jgi:hypothetical protein
MKTRKCNIARKPKAATIRKACESAHPKPNPQREAAHISAQSGFVPQNPPSSNDGVRDSPPEAGSRNPESASFRKTRPYPTTALETHPREPCERQRAPSYSLKNPTKL